jgi:hypothetical protein
MNDTEAALREQLQDLRDQVAERDHTIQHLRRLLAHAQAVNPLRRVARAA